MDESGIVVFIRHHHMSEVSFTSQKALDMYLIMSGYPRNASIDDVDNAWWRMMLGTEVNSSLWDRDTTDRMFKLIKPWKLVAWNMAFEVLIGKTSFYFSWKQILEERAKNLEEIERLEY
jgi:hypothetical protein